MAWKGKLRVMNDLTVLTDMNQTIVCSFVPPDSVLERIIAQFHRLARPVFLGEISLEVGWSLERVQQMLQRLIDSGVIREATGAEVQSLGGLNGSFVYALTTQASPALARW
jgi:hypothetical protein